MTLDAQSLTAAAIGTEYSILAEATMDIDSAIASNDVQKAWADDVLDRLATLDVAEWGRLRSKLMTKFGPGLSVRTFDKAVDDRRRKLRAPRIPRQQGPLPDIQVNGRPLRDQSSDAINALLAQNNPPQLFVRGGEMVCIEMDERQRPKIESVSVDNLRGRMERSANYIRQGDTAYVPSPPPFDVVKDVLALAPAEWKFPPLEVLVEVPTLRPDGTVLEQRGYDSLSHMYYEPSDGLVMAPVPHDPCTDEVREAVELIDDVICDFPFCKDGEEDGESSSKANFFGLLLTPIVRPAIGGCTPIALIDAPQAGTGKSLLAKVLSIITTGREASMVPLPRDDQEIQKLVGATLAAGRSLVCFDNVEGVLASPTLALALTAREYETRILGLSENMVVPNRATWLATGNNIRPSGDMPRRCYHIRIDAESSQPYRGRTFKHDPLEAWVMENRAALLRALLIIARAWYAQGCRRVVDAALGSFEEWHRAIAGMLHGAGVKGFLDNLDPFLDSADESQVQWERFLKELQREYDFTGGWFTGNMIAERMRRSSDVAPNPFSLPDSLGDVDRRREGGLERAINRSLTKRLGTRHGRRQLHLVRRHNEEKDMMEWSVAGKGAKAAKGGQ